MKRLNDDVLNKLSAEELEMELVMLHDMYENQIEHRLEVSSYILDVESALQLKSERV